MTIHSHAKINLGLRVLGKRDDGYHDLATIFVPVDLCDTVELHTRDLGLSMECTRDDVPCDSGNLCLRAAAEVYRFAGGGGVHIALDKRIPVGAGLGGGSSNAAMVLRALPRLWGVDIPDDELHAMAARLGSDVPFFLHDGPALAGGRGEILTPLNVRLPWWIVLVTPGIHVSTAWAYAALGTREWQPDPRLDLLLTDAVRGGDSAPLLVNDFEPAVFERWPAIAEMKRRLLENGAVGALMSGSGSTVFGLFSDALEAQAALAEFAPGQVLGVTAPDFSPMPFTPRG